VTESTISTRLSPSVARGLPLRRKLDEGARLFRIYRAEARADQDLEWLFDEVDEYRHLLECHSGTDLENANIFEIGFGPRPYRQIILQSMGINARGVDIEAPLLPGRPTQFILMLRRNGVERAAKTLIRSVFFDRRERRLLERGLHRRGLARRLDPERLTVADAGELELPPASLDLIFSEDVFEHMERTTLERVVALMATWLKPGGLALVRPNVFTGITGGHLIEWSRRALRLPPTERQSEPWDHLRKRRAAPNTYLNELTRADYRALFGRHFEILEEQVAQPDLGREYLDARARAELRDWPEDELFSNQTMFVLRPHRAP
jgi:Methyltransferase domain